MLRAKIHVRDGEQMEIRDVLAALRRSWYLPVAGVILGLLLAAFWLSGQTPLYRATAQVFASTAREANQGMILQSAAFAQARTTSYAQLVDSPQVLDPVARELGLPGTGADLAGKVSAVNPPQTVLLDVSATDASPAMAAAIANSAAKELAATIERLETPGGRQATSPIRLTVTNPAGTPGAPISPNTKQTLGLALLFGLGLGCGLAVLRDRLDKSVKSVTDLVQLAGSSTLGVIGFDPDAEKNQLVALDQRAVRSESFRTIRTNLQYVDVDDPPTVIAVASAVPEEGKSTSACNLAITMAQAGQRVCLVETDLRRPRIANYLGIDSTVGLTDVLAGKVDLEAALLPWNRYLLTVLPSGAIPPNPSELLASQQMKNTFTKLRLDFDAIILDTAPLLTVADGSIATAAADGAVLIVKHGSTSRDQVTKALQALDQVGARLLGTVLNFAPAKRGGYGYGYGYGYGSADAQKGGRKGRKAKPAPVAPVPAPLANTNPGREAAESQPV